MPDRCIYSHCFLGDQIEISDGIYYPGSPLLDIDLELQNAEMIRSVLYRNNLEMASLRQLL